MKSFVCGIGVVQLPALRTDHGVHVSNGAYIWNKGPRRTTCWWTSVCRSPRRAAAGCRLGNSAKIISQAAVTGYTRIKRATHSSRHLCETGIGQGNNCTEVHVHPSHPSRRTTHHIPCRMRQCGVRRHIPRHRRQLPLCQVCVHRGKQDAVYSPSIAGHV